MSQITQLVYMICSQRHKWTIFGPDLHVLNLIMDIIKFACLKPGYVYCLLLFFIIVILFITGEDDVMILPFPDRTFPDRRLLCKHLHHCDNCPSYL